eukprot:TRINITY_DN11406_c0_g1_i1.p3 TRINITY_DN11406_c0_g1~~TRINITY_DN11406_c0_g1_i1.p3  ORF type:complete len:60 (+),score=11.21 TRINITY_DN11406_c0_g1_i1:793-972(+)
MGVVESGTVSFSLNGAEDCDGGQSMSFSPIPRSPFPQPPSSPSSASNDFMGRRVDDHFF